MTIAAVIPARYHSSRFSGKPLADIRGKPMVQHVYERARSAALVDEILVATDDARIADAVGKFGGKAVMTSPDHRTGTERVAEVAVGLKAEIIANIQGDEPLIRGDIIDEAIRPLISNKSIQISTLKTPITRTSDWFNPNVVKVVTDREGFALYFSRSPIPFFLDESRGDGSFLSSGREHEHDSLPPGPLYRHIGLYIYRRSLLLSIAEMEPTPLERAEGLEQLRLMENGYRIKVIPIDYYPLSVDTPEDLEEVRERLAGKDFP
ncbi:MAG: 3-deoxy-manno-octulosonate cytidylyltransferase [Deltaproteobacteria bacterium]|nr:3-deoxy-manno-octulosonate cytidylyltransferase [Deltaproteobacteria bacterium]